MTADLRLECLKFSHATGQVNGKIPWGHTLGSDLMVVVSGSHMLSARVPLNMQIYQGNSVIVRCHSPISNFGLQLS